MKWFGCWTRSTPNTNLRWRCSPSERPVLGAPADRGSGSLALGSRSRRPLRCRSAGRRDSHRALRRWRPAAFDGLGGVESLTASERRVADLAAEGNSNREIAQTLHVTPKTVEVHLSSVYRRL